jgi:tetratricopeptide (TPR) repeat protein
MQSKKRESYCCSPQTPMFESFLATLLTFVWLQAFYALALALKGLHRYEEALEALDQGLIDNPNDRVRDIAFLIFSFL